MKLRSFWTLAVVFAILHLAVALGCLSISFGASMAGFDDPEATVSPVDQALGTMAGILMLPGRMVWSLIGKDAPAALEWALMLANSLVWGAGAAGVVLCLNKGWALRGMSKTVE